MTAVICGGSFDVDWLTSVVLSYDSLCSNTDLEAASQKETNSWCRDGSAAEVELKTKYFTAKLKLLPAEVNVDDGIYGSESLTRALESVEGLIDIVPYNEDIDVTARSSLSDSFQGLTNISVRLLVSLKRATHEEMSDDERMKRLLWALDSGFEHIEIDEKKLLEGWQNREKDGLPRLMEALQSNKWSTMVVKRQDQEQVQEATKLMDVGVKATSNDPDDSAVKKSIDKSLLDLDLDAEVSDELDEELYGQFADVISKAKEYRDQAVAGGVGDEERRSRAEAVALALSSMLGVSEGDSD